jgi:L,D-peptidoglycan transpeptidase YkuD (ErfK/YbiS/YcfS/YnhG family)
MHFFNLPSHVERLVKVRSIAGSLFRWPASHQRSLTESFDRSLLILCILLSTFHCSAAAPVLRREAFSLRDSTQMLVVTTPEGNAGFGTLRRYERSERSGKWEVVGHPLAVVVGKKGLGWASESEVTDTPGAQNLKDPVKKEGDLRSPAGIFHLGTTFGYAPLRPQGWTMPYLHLTSSTECVDDPHSKYYNQVLDRSTVSPDWKSSEHMLRTDDLYEWGVVVEQNVDPVQPGAGSCVFLHIWGGPGQGTVGCTATAQQQLEGLLGWLDPYKSPVLVQLPAARYASLQKAWGLPALP